MSSRHRITGTLNLRQSRAHFGCHSGRGVLAEQWRVLAPGLSRSFVELTTDQRKQLGWLAHHMVGQVDGREEDQDGYTDSDNSKR
jgi:hypothetical protein